MQEFNTTESVRDQQGTVNWGDELSTALDWMNKRAWALGGAVLFYATIYLHHYITEEKVALSITSPAAVAALPTMLVLVLFVVAMLMALLAIPTTALFTPLEKSRGSTPLWLDSDLEKSRRSISLWLDSDQPQERSLGRLILLAWIVWTLAVGAGLCATAYVGTHKDFSQAWPWLAFILLLVPSIALALVLVTKIPLRRITCDYWIAFVGGCFTQYWVLTMFMQVVLQAAAKYIDSWHEFSSVFLAAVLPLGILQLFAAYIFQAVRRHKRPFAFAGGMTAFIMSILGLVPQASAMLVGYAIQATANGGRNCTVLSFAPNAASKYAMLRSTPNSEKSQNLRIVFDTGDTYQVRPIESEGKPVFFVQRIDVSGIDACPASKKP